MAVKLHGFPLSPNTQLVALILEELKVPYEFVLIDITKGHQKTDEYLGKNPFGQTPMLEDDGLFVYESQAIARYLVAKYGKDSGLAPSPSDIVAYAKFEQAMATEIFCYHSNATQLGWQKKFAPIFGVQVDEPKCQELEATLKSKLLVYNTILSKQKYLAGDVVTLADLVHIPWGYVVQSDCHIAVFETQPLVSKWWKDITSRPAWPASLKKLGL